MRRSILLLLLLLLIDVNISISTELHVVPFASLVDNNNDGSLENPYTSLQQALNHVEGDYDRNIDSIHRVTIHLYPTYHFVSTIRLGESHSHIRLTTMTDIDIAFYDKLFVRNILIDDYQL